MHKCNARSALTQPLIMINIQLVSIVKSSALTKLPDNNDYSSWKYFFLIPAKYILFLGVFCSDGPIGRQATKIKINYSKTIIIIGSSFLNKLLGMFLKHNNILFTGRSRDGKANVGTNYLSNFVQFKFNI